MYNEFSITGVAHSIANKSITIETNMKLNEKSVTMSNINLKYNDSGKTVNYTLSVDKKNIIIQFVDWPSPNIEYFLSVSNITDALDRPIKSPFNQVIIFESEIKQKIAFITPTCDEAIKSNVLEVIVKATPEDEPVKGYYYEIASDVAFCDARKITSAESTLQITDLPYGQSFIRARVQDQNDSEIYGEWSDTISFVMINNKCDDNCECDNEENPFIEDMLSLDPILVEELPIDLVSIPSNGKTQESIYLVFDKEIDPNSIPLFVTAYRRDL